MTSIRRKNKPLLIGEASHDPDKMPFSGFGGRKLALLCGVDDITKKFDTANVFPNWPGYNGHGDAFPFEPARQLAKSMIPKLKGRTVLLAGKRVARAFGIPDGGTYFRRMKPSWCLECWVIPHPSGINRWWNDPANLLAALRFFRRHVS